MKKVNTILIIAVLTALVFSSCQKQPQADFTTDKTTYVAGETVKLTNTSIDADHYKWTMPDGQTSTSADVDYTTNVNSAAGTLNFKLEAFSKNGNKTDEASRSVTLQAATGDVTFYNEYAGTYRIQVTIGTQSKIINSDNSTSPGCNATGCANFSLTSGTYSYSAVDLDWTPAGSWTGTVDVTANGCTTIKLIDSKSKN